MYIYIIIKLLLEAMGLYLNIRLRYFFIFFEIFLIALYVYLLYDNIYLWNSYLFAWSIFWIILFLLYRLIDYIFVNRKKIILKFNDGIKEKVKNIVLRKKFLDFTYYFIWFLPWNIGYYLYFWLMEYGWYYRVWFTSTRDIFFWKYFKWDSRIFFFRLNIILFENIFIYYVYFLKNELVKSILRFLLIISWVRNKMIKKSIVEYMLWRLLAFSYLSMFFFYAFEHIQLINKWIIIFILLIEILFLIIIGKILEYFLNQDVLTGNYKYITVLVEFIDINNIFLIVDPLDYSWSKQIKTFFETNGMVWNKILGNSLSLNILYEFMLYINKVTKGYYFHEYNIMTRMKIEKLYKESNIPWDILPRTRYVIMNLRYVQYNFGLMHSNLYYSAQNNVEPLEVKKFIPDYRLKAMKNMYLTLFEKTYSDVSLLVIVFLLRLNPEINYEIFRCSYYSVFIDTVEMKKYNFFERQIAYLYRESKPIVIKLWLAKISKENPKLLNAAYFLHTFESNLRLYDLEGYFMFELLNENIKFYGDKLSVISSQFCSITNYKNKFELLSKLLMFEEEAIVWNKDIVDFFGVINDMKSNKDLVKLYINNLKHILSKIEEHNIDFTQDWIIFSDSILILTDFYKIIFDEGFNLFELNDFDLINLLFHENVVIKDIMLLHEYQDLINYYYLYLEELEELKYESIELFENARISE